MSTSNKRNKPTWTEFECPECTAENPLEDGFTYGDEVFCYWCGCRFTVRKMAAEDEKYRLIRD